jgi:hypothetical protein
MQQLTHFTSNNYIHIYNTIIDYTREYNGSSILSRDNSLYLCDTGNEIEMTIITILDRIDAWRCAMSPTWTRVIHSTTLGGIGGFVSACIVSQYSG